MMKKKMLVIFLTILMLLTATAATGEDLSTSNSSSETSSIHVYVRTELLNGRADPRKTGFIEARFDAGDLLEATGEWSDDHHWIEVVGGETGTVWVYADYVSETKRDLYYINNDYKKVKIRSKPVNGKIVSYLKKGKKIKITAIVLGWGKTKKGWIDMSYLEKAN